MTAAAREAVSERIHDAADALIAHLTTADIADPGAYWAAFRALGRTEADAVSFVVDVGALDVADMEFVAERIRDEVEEWVAWLNEADRADPAAYYKTAHELIVGSLWYRLAYPIMFGLRDGVLDRAPFAVELALLTDEDGHTSFGPYLEDVEEQAEVECRRAFLLAELEASGGATTEHAAAVDAVRGVAPDDVTSDHLDALEEALIARYAEASGIADEDGRHRLVSWLRTQARMAAIKLIRAKHQETPRLREFLAKPDDEIEAVHCTGIHRLRVAAGL